MSSHKAFVLVLTLVASAVIAVHGEEETTEKLGFIEAAKAKWQQGVEAAKEGMAEAEGAYNNAKEKIGPMASSFSEGFKDKFNEGVQKVQDVFKDAKDKISTHVSSRR